MTPSVPTEVNGKHFRTRVNHSMILVLPAFILPELLVPFKDDWPNLNFKLKFTFIVDEENIIATNCRF